MASATRHRSRRPAVNTPSLSSDDGTLADTPLTVTPVDVVATTAIQFEQNDDGSQLGRPQCGVVTIDEIAPLGVNVIEALGIVSRLEQLSLDKQEISLPKCIVLGQQSTGKSSVIEAISGIKTPRDTGTCTRCPLFIELQPSADPHSGWHARVYLLRQYELVTDSRAQGLDTEFPGWVPSSTPGRTPFAETDNPEQLESLIRCAQRATLSPLEKPELFLEPSFDDRHIHKTLFSPNVVCIVVSKPNLPPLSFYDLPGMIGQAETEEEAYTVPLVKNLVTKYIQDPEALVLVTCALENDIANSIAAGLARDLKVTDRCMGVLTKPDRLPQGSSASELANILEGHRFKLGHNYFVVKNLNSDEIKQGLTHYDARGLEQRFFSTVAPWSTDLRSYQPRFGTVNLQRYLSTQLGNRVMDKLPSIYRQIEASLAAVDEELSRIPDTPLYSATRTVAGMLESFAADVRNEMAGVHGHVLWSRTWTEIQKEFWDALLMSKPTLTPVGELDKGIFASTLPGSSADESIVIDSDDDNDMSCSPDTPSKKRKCNPSTKREPHTPGPASSPFRAPKTPASRTSRILFPKVASSARPNTVATVKKPLKLDDITWHIDQQSVSKVPGQINHQVREEMMLAALENWPLVIDNFFKSLDRHLKQRIQTMFDEHFHERKGSELYAASLAIVKTTVDNNLHEQQNTMAAESLNDEREGVHIFHKDTFEKEKAAWIERCTQVRRDKRLKVLLKEAAEFHDRELSRIEVDRLKKDEKKMAVVEQEPYECEIDLVAHAASYYMIAARRFHDSVTMRIESKFFKQLREKLLDQLQDELGIYDEQKGPHNAQRLLAESPERLARRNMLVAKKKALVEGLQSFDDHYRKYQAKNAPGSIAGVQSEDQHPRVTEVMEDVEADALALR